MFSPEVDHDANDHGTELPSFCAIAQLLGNLGGARIR